MSIDPTTPAAPAPHLWVRLDGEGSDGNIEVRTRILRAATELSAASTRAAVA